jgi:hypothetical protein
MRRPGRLWRELGPGGFVSFVLLLGCAHRVIATTCSN